MAEEVKTPVVETKVETKVETPVVKAPLVEDPPKDTSKDLGDKLVKMVETAVAGTQTATTTNAATDTKVETKVVVDPNAPKRLITDDDAPAAKDETGAVKPGTASVPLDYKLELPANIKLSAAELPQLEKTAKALGLDKAKATQLVTDYAAMKAAEVNSMANTWYEQSVNHPEWGGKKIDATMAEVKRAMGYLPTELRKEIANGPFANHPKLIEMVYTLAKRIPSEDKHIAGTQTPAPTGMPKTVQEAAQRMFGHIK